MQPLPAILGSFDILRLSLIVVLRILDGAFFFRKWVDVSLILLAMGLMLIVDMIKCEIRNLYHF